MRILKILYYALFFFFFAVVWWRLVPTERMLWMLLSAIAVVVLLHIITYRKYGKIITLNTKTDSVIIIAIMLSLVIIQYAVIE